MERENLYRNQQVALMNSLIIHPVGGLYRELYYPAPDSLVHTEKAINNQNILDANSLFWAEILSPQMVEKTVKSAAESAHNPEHTPLSFKAAFAVPKAFVSRVLDAKIRVADQGITPQRFFADIETLNIYCALYAKTIGSYTATFSVQNGWFLSEDSSEEIFQKCLEEKENPYLSFIRTAILPLVKAAQPSIVFLTGRPGYFSFALARLIKSLLSSTLICVTRHSSEYYSMNKIDFLLTRNNCFFQAFDVIILEQFSQVEQELLAACAKDYPFYDIHNIIFRSKAGNITHTGYNQSPSSVCTPPAVQRRPQARKAQMHVPPDKVINVHLFPYVKCYWNKCNFCGINRKYHFENPEKSYASIERQLERLKREAENAQYIWFIDEALPPEILGKIATHFIHSIPGIIWQARCRIEQELLTEGLPETLARAGLRELRLGLESGSLTVLQEMNKFDSSFSFSLVDEICKRYSACGISIHFPVIIGFPGETDSDRQATYNLLHSLTGKYSTVTFNVNLFGLDIGSRVFQHWHDFDIQSISFPCKPAHYLGNVLPWSSPSMNFKVLARERDQFMRELLYPWMPVRTLTPPHILYRLSETIRNTLLWKTRSLWPKVLNPVAACQKLRVGDITSIYDEEKDIYYIYCWDSHHYMIGDRSLFDFIQLFQTPDTLDNVLETFCGTATCPYTSDELRPLAERLLRDQYLIADQ